MNKLSSNISYKWIQSWRALQWYIILWSEWDSIYADHVTDCPFKDREWRPHHMQILLRYNTCLSCPPTWIPYVSYISLCLYPEPTQHSSGPRRTRSGDWERHVSIQINQRGWRVPPHGHSPYSVWCDSRFGTSVGVQQVRKMINFLYKTYF